MENALHEKPLLAISSHPKFSLSISNGDQQQLICIFLAKYSELNCKNSGCCFNVFLCGFYMRFVVHKILLFNFEQWLCKYFVNKKIKYLWDADAQNFVKLRFLLVDSRIDYSIG